jgi:hypothetical protein
MNKKEKINKLKIKLRILINKLLSKSFKIKSSKKVTVLMIKFVGQMLGISMIGL